VYFTSENISLRSPEQFCFEEYSNTNIDMNTSPSEPPTVEPNSQNKRNLSESTYANTSGEIKKGRKIFDLNLEWNGED